MGIGSLVTYITNAQFALLFAVVVSRAIRQRSRVWIETALFFGCATLLVAGTWAVIRFNPPRQHLLDVVNVTLIVSMAFLVLRLTNYLSAIPRSVIRAATAGYGLLVLGALAARDVNSPYVLLPVVVYFGVLVLFAAVVMAAAGIRARGVSRRRMLAVATGSFFLSGTVVVSGLRAAVPHVAGISHPLIGGPLALVSGLAYFVGFATPSFLRQGWQDRVLRQFFSQTMTLSRAADVSEVVLGFETAVRRSHGGSPVWMVMWDPAVEALRFVTRGDDQSLIRPNQMIEGRVFSSQYSIASSNLFRDDPPNAALYRELGVTAVICAPVSIGERRFGALAVYAARPPMFVDDELQVVSLMAEQAATVLESHALMEQTARLRAREEATRLKDDFLAAAAHDLRNPLSAVVMQAHLIQRRFRRQPDAPPDPGAIQSLIDQADRLQSFVDDLLEVQRIESEGLALDRSDVDLAVLVAESVSRLSSTPHTARLDLQRSVIVNGDRGRILRLIDNLLSNAVKYSPNGGEILLRLWSDRQHAHLTVRDQGIGIPVVDLPYIFDRFHRGSNTEGTSLRGVGLGLYICRAVAEAHGGSISATSEAGRWSEFHVVLPVARNRWTEPSAGNQPSTPGRLTLDRGSVPAESNS